MKTKLIWDEAKRQANLEKHGLDFADARVVLDSFYRLDIDSIGRGEARIKSLSYVTGGILAMLVVVHTDRAGEARIISFRCASSKEREAYYDWLA